ncbi:glycoside hydrolase family 88 protein [Galbibacter sp. EGI 63066]|uniref:glycoside hydrolase family 88/105 protein n=1 Tax=Galbibacter sp. EGI 63066 TaxID=2993559 RepID=UPI0022490CDA|nr:glycoside hydrolase family 88 protein [Galbibacter sp. EGI 63066]MCX2678585.1 glycoside hydrolase family 88 protein [Galbibacter sp. EGI 63066]
MYHNKLNFVNNRLKTAGLSMLFCVLCSSQVFSQYTQKSGTDSDTPLHLLKPQYKIPYGVPEKESIVAVLDRVYTYLNNTTPPQLLDVETNKPVKPKDVKKHSSVAFKQGDFRLVSYEWGVTYAGMLLAGQTTGDEKYTEYTTDRMEFLSELYPQMVAMEKKNQDYKHPMKSVLHPDALDDAGAMCAAMIKTKNGGFKADLDPMINNFIKYISEGQYRLQDGTLARNRPMKNSLWLDDLFMGVPALAQMGKYSGDNKYFDDAIKQVLQFSKRMFNEEKNLYMHAWIEGMEEHPQFHWGRANGWAIMTLVELLEVLPENHKGRTEVLSYLQKHIKGLAHYQSPDGLWHQLLDRNDSFLETSATAIFTYAIARSINRGYVDAKVYGPVVSLAWNAISTKVNDKGQVEGTCVGTGMGFDPAFYYYRPVNVYAAHGYGPVLLAGAEMIDLLKKNHPKMNDSAVMYYSHPINTDAPIFKEK